jgi:hypothetical protein
VFRTKIGRAIWKTPPKLSEWSLGKFSEWSLGKFGKLSEWSLGRPGKETSLGGLGGLKWSCEDAKSI